MSILNPGHSWSEIKSELEKLSSLVPAGEILELAVFGGSTVLYWGMEGRLSRDVDVQQSQSSPFLIDLAPSVSRCTKLGDWRAVALRGSLFF
jgi:hypothetical protein